MFANDPDLNARIILTIGAVLGTVAVWFISPTKKDEGTFWTFGKSNAVRSFAYGPDDTLRPEFKPTFTVLAVVFIAVVWLVRTP